MVESRLQESVFETVDGTGQLLGRIQGAVTGILQPIADAGGFVAKYNSVGLQTNPAYTHGTGTLPE